MDKKERGNREERRRRGWGNWRRWREREEEGEVDNTRITMREFCSVGGGGNGGGGRNEFTHNIPKTFTFSVKEKQSFVITIYVCLYIYRSVTSL